MVPIIIQRILLLLLYVTYTGNSSTFGVLACAGGGLGVNLTMFSHCDLFSNRYVAHAFNFFLYPHSFGPIDSRFLSQVCKLIAVHLYSYCQSARDISFLKELHKEYFN